MIDSNLIELSNLIITNAFSSNLRGFLKGNAKNLLIDRFDFSHSKLKNFVFLDVKIESILINNLKLFNLTMDADENLILSFFWMKWYANATIQNSNFEQIFSKNQVLFNFESILNDMASSNLTDSVFQICELKSLLKFAESPKQINLERISFSKIISYTSIIETDSQIGKSFITLEYLNFIENLSPRLLSFSIGSSLILSNITVNLNNYNLSERTILAGPFLYIENYCYVFLTNMIINGFYASQEIPGMVFLQTRKMLSLFSGDYLIEKNQFYILNSKFTKTGLHSTFNGKFAKVTLYYESILTSNLTIDNCLFQEAFDSKFSGLYLIGIYNKISNVVINNVDISRNSNLFGILEIVAFSTSLRNSCLKYNTYLTVNLINYFVNFIEEISVTFDSNQADVSNVEINPYDKSSFQFYSGDKIMCSSSSVNFFGACYHFKPTYNGNYTLNNSIFMYSVSYYLSAVIDIFCANPTFLPTFYVFSNLVFIKNWSAKESGAISYFFHDSIYNSYLINCIFEENSSAKGGVMIVSLDNRSNKLYIQNCSFIGNHAEGGGALSIVSGTLIIIDSYFINNTATRAGSIEALNYNFLNITNTLFLNSIATKYAGVILIIDNIDLYLNNITVVNSFSTFGGFIYSDAYSFIDFRKGILKNCSGESGTILFMSKNKKENSSYFDEVLFDSIKSEKNCFFIDISDLIFKNCQFNNFSSLLFFLSSSSLNFNDSNIEQGYCYHESEEGCLFRSQTDTLIYINNVNISKLNISAYGGIFYVSGSQAFLNKANIKDITDSKVGSFFYAVNSIIDVQNVVLNNIKYDLIYGFLSSIMIRELSFYNVLKENFEFSAINIDSCYKFIIDESNFQNIISIKNGGLVYFSNEELIDDLVYKIKNSNFSNISGANGGVFYIENTNLSLVNSGFKNNSGIDGGVIFYQCDDHHSTFCDLDLQNNIFENNKASNHGGALKWLYMKPRNISKNKFVNNIALNYGNNIASFPIRLLIHIKNNDLINEELQEFIILKNIRSGQKIEDIIEVFLIDESNQRIVNIVNAKMYINIITDPLIIQLLSKRFNLNVEKNNKNYTTNLTDIAGQTSQNINENSSYIFDDLTVTGTPSTKVFLSFTSSLIKEFRSDLFNSSFSKNNYNDSNYQYVYYLPLSVVECVVGEIYDSSSNTCRACPKGTFSFEIFSDNCESCFENAECNGGNSIIVAAGFWRANPYSKNIYKCTSNLYLCKGGYNSSCEEGYSGNLCEICNDINGNRAEKNYFGLCQECADLGMNILITIPLAIGVAIILRFLSTFFLEKSKTTHNIINCSLIKLLILHYQMLILVPNVNLSLGRTPNDSIGSLTKNWFAFDCIFTSAWGFKSSLNNRMLSISILFIFGIFIINLILFKCKRWSIYDKIKKYFVQKDSYRENQIEEGHRVNIQQSPKQNISQPTNYIVNIITYNVIFFYLVQSSIIDLSFLGMRCVDIEDKSYSRYGMDYECWNTDHFLWIWLCYVPNIIFWMFLLTYLFYYALKVVKKYHPKNIIIASVGFKKKYRWKGDVFNLARKTLIVITSTFSSENSETIPFTIFLLSAFLLLMHFYFKPYNYKVLNRMDAYSLYIVFFTYYSLSYYYTGINQELSDFFYFMLIIFNIFFFVIWCIIFFRRPIRRILGMVRKGREDKIIPYKVKK